MFKGRSWSGQELLPVLRAQTHYSLIYMHKRSIFIFLKSSSLFSVPLPQWSRRSTCRRAPAPCWTAATSRWWPPASRSEAAPKPTSSGRRSCTGAARSRATTRPTAPAPPTCATCGSRRATPTARSSPAWCATRHCRPSSASRTRWTFSVSVFPWRLWWLLFPTSGRMSRFDFYHGFDDHIEGSCISLQPIVFSGAEKGFQPSSGSYCCYCFVSIGTRLLEYLPTEVLECQINSVCSSSSESLCTKAAIACWIM